MRRAGLAGALALLGLLSGCAGLSAILTAAAQAPPPVPSSANLADQVLEYAIGFCQQEPAARAALIDELNAAAKPARVVIDCGG